METIDETRLESDLEYRYQYLCRFVGFGPDDIVAIQEIAPHLGPSIPALVEQTYTRLLAFDATARHFLPRPSGFTGTAAASLSAMSLADPQIQFRREHLMRYLMHLLGHASDAKLFQYFDMVGKIHTPAAGNREVSVPLVQMNALMGLLSDLLLGAIADLPLEPGDRLRASRAFLKLLWIQNDFVMRQY
ncbi:MAG TPA: hypothetical protein DDY91_07515 [Planctomycetaceae bacterium]|nr:hypothetical protein [Planctomycetaceae bacterium]